MEGRPVSVVATDDVNDKQFDSLVLVLESINKIPDSLNHLKHFLSSYKEIDASVESAVTLHKVENICGSRLIVSPTGPVDRDYDDVRRYYDAAKKGIERALSAGSKAPLILRPKLDNDMYSMATRVTIMGGLEALYVPIQVREMRPLLATKANLLGIWHQDKLAADNLAEIVNMIESGRYACRDIGGGDPERMAPPNVAEYVQNMFKDSTTVKVTVQQDIDYLSKEYPLFGAVNRACKDVVRHQARLILLEYEGDGPIEETIMLVGKGITYDTGGADVKTGGAMRGMHRDKCGAAAVAGFFKILSLWKPKNIKVIGSMSMVRNSIGSESYVSDEIIMSRAGKRVLIGNTDAEGRMVMADLLCLMKEKALHEVNPKIFTIATLTGHVIRAYSDQYTAVMGNGPSCEASIPSSLQKTGDLISDMFEISTIRREDYKNHTGKSESEDIVQSGGNPSTQTPRGHQSPSAFLIMASGLDAHGRDSERPLKYTHLDIAGSSGPFPGNPTGAPIVALAHEYIFSKESTSSTSNSSL